MDETKYLQAFMEKELSGIKDNLAHGVYQDRDAYLRVLGECQTLIKMINETKRLISKREDDEPDDEV